jgi:tRNA acetyltransferase TAN1
VDLSNAEKTIMVQLLKSSAAMSVVSNYKQLAKFNVRELSITDEEQQKAAKAASSKDEPAAAGSSAKERTVQDKEATAGQEGTNGDVPSTVPDALADAAAEDA